MRPSQDSAANLPAGPSGSERPEQRAPVPSRHWQIDHWQLDHLVFAASDLTRGRAWLEEALGTALQPGGEHPRFGTHNLLLGLGGSYLELIAVNPDAPAPQAPRWFELGTAAMQARLTERPRLIHWVAAVPSLAGHPLALPLERGPNRWQLTVAPDGSLPGGGPVPSLIAWDTPSPAQTLAGSGVSLHTLELLSPQPDDLAPWTRDPAARGHGPTIRAGWAAAPQLRATFGTSAGLVTLD